MDDFIAPIIFAVIFVGVIAAMVYGLVSITRRSTTSVDPGIGTVRRFYFYSVAFVAVMLAANGFALFIGCRAHPALERAQLPAVCCP